MARKKITPERTDHRKPFAYENWQDAPVTWRKLNEVRLSLEQVNEIVRRAYELGADNAQGVFVPNWGAARDEFRSKNEIVANQWVPRKGFNGRIA